MVGFFFFFLSGIFIEEAGICSMIDTGKKGYKLTEQILFNFLPSCADPGIIVFVRGGGGGRGSGQSAKNSSENVLYFFSPQLTILKSNGLFQRKLSFCKVLEGVQHFQGGVTFSRGEGGPIAYSL